MNAIRSIQTRGISCNFWMFNEYTTILVLQKPANNPIYIFSLWFHFFRIFCSGPNQSRKHCWKHYPSVRKGVNQMQQIVLHGMDSNNTLNCGQIIWSNVNNNCSRWMAINYRELNFFQKLRPFHTGYMDPLNTLNITSTQVKLYMPGVSSFFKSGNKWITYHPDICN